MTMKKTSLLFLILFVGGFSSSVYAQHELIDARILYLTDTEQIEKKLAACKDELSSQEEDDLVNIIHFIKDPWSPENKKLNIAVWEKAKTLKCGNLRSDSNEFGQASASVISNLTGALPIADLQSKLIYGLTDLLIERAKAELTLKYLNTFLAELDSTKELTVLIPGHSDTTTLKFRLKELLPHVYDFLNDQDAVYSINIGKSFKAAFEADAKDLMKNMLKVFEKNEDLNTSFEYRYASATFTVVNDLIIGTHPSLIISKLAGEFPVSNNTDPAGISINMLNIISMSLINTNNDSSYWLSPKTLLKMNVTEMKYYMALLYLNHKDVLQFIPLIDFKNKQEKYNTLIFHSAAYLSQLEDMMNELGSGSIGNGNNFLNQFSMSSAKSNRTEELSPSQKIARFANYTALMLEMINSAMNELCELNIDDGQFCNKYKGRIDKAIEGGKIVSNFVYSAGTGDYAAAAMHTLHFIKSYCKNDSLPQKLGRYITIVADIAQADSVEQVKKILDGLIMPVGSYKVKRTQTFTISINSYVGLSTGYEWNDATSDIENKNSWQFSPFVPVGIDISWVHKCKKFSDERKVHSSNGIYLSVIDLGAVASYRFKNTGSNDSLTVSELPKINLRQVLSPGLYYVHGIRNAPLSWGVGGQFNPKLREIKENGELVETANAFRFMFFLSVDIPLFTVSSGYRNK